MAFGDRDRDTESIFSKTARLMAGAALTVGAGAALYKGYQDSPNAFDRALRTVQNLATGKTAAATRQTMSSTPRIFDESMLKQAYETSQQVMGISGSREFLRRAYEGAAYSAGSLNDVARESIVGEILSKSGSWEEARAALIPYESELGGLENIYREMKNISGGRMPNSRDLSVSEILRDLSTGHLGPGGKPTRTPYAISDFSPGERFWRNNFPMEAGGLPEIPLPKMSLGMNDKISARRMSEAFGVSVRAGVRDHGRPRLFDRKNRLTQSFDIPGVGSVTLPYTEFQLGGKNSRNFLQVPRSKSGRIGEEVVSFVATDHRGKGYAAVPRFSIPKAGGGVEVISWNQAMGILIHGDKDLGIEGVALEFYKAAGDKKALRDITSRVNTAIRGLYQRVSGSQADMTQAIFHSQSVVSLNRLIETIKTPGTKLTIDDVVKDWETLQSSGISVGPLASAGPTAKSGRLALRDWAKELDIFGENYPMERQYLSRFRPFQLADEALGVVEANPIMGVIQRGSPITATGTYNKVVQNKMPSMLGVYSLRKGGGVSIRPEEAFISRRVAPMLTTKHYKTVEVATGSIMAGLNETFFDNQLIGKDYRTGQEVRGMNRAGQVQQRITSAVNRGEFTQLEIETTLPLQESMKTFGLRVQLRDTANIAESAKAEYGMSNTVMKYLHQAEYVGSAESLKNIPAEINRQVAEAMTLTSAQRLQESHVSSRMRRGKRKVHIRGSRSKVVGDLAQNSANEMWRFVHNTEARQKFLAGSVVEGARLAKEFGLTDNAADLAPGLALIKKASAWTKPGELGLVGGLHYMAMAKEIGEERTVEILGKLGLTSQHISQLQSATEVLGMPTMNIGGYASFDHAWSRARMDYRGLQEIKAQNWGTAGDLFIEDILRSTVHKDLGELEKAAISLTGKSVDLAKDIKRVEKFSEAKDLLGKEGFVWAGGGKSFYVPPGSGPGMQMGLFTQEVGVKGEQSLRRAYSNYMDTASQLEGMKKEMEEIGMPETKAYQKLTEDMKDVEQTLMQQVHKEWAAAASARGKMIGSSMPVARSWLGQVHEFKSMEEVLADQQRMFVRGTTAKTYDTMHKDLMRFASPEEKIFLEAQKAKFLKGEKVVSLLGRHPTHRPQSAIPGYLQRVESEVEGDFIQTLTLREGGEVYDISTAAGQKLDTDFDHTMLKIVGNEKAALELDKMMQSSEYRKEFVAGIKRQKFIKEAIDTARAAGNTTEARHIIGLNRLVGGKMRVGQLSNVIGEMRAAAAFNMSSKDFTMASYLLAEMEEGGLTPKKGFSSVKVEDLLQDFVSGRDKWKMKASAEQAWDELIKKPEIVTPDMTYEKNKVIAQLQDAIQTSTDNGELAAYRNGARKAAKASKGAVWANISEDDLVRSIKMNQAGKGDLLSTMVREMRMGPGSGINKSRQAMGAMESVGRLALNAFKKHWKYPAAGAAVALGLVAMAGGSDLKMRQAPDVNSTALAAGGPADIRTPGVFHPRIFTSGDGGGNGGYQMSYRGNMGSDIRGLSGFGGEVGAGVTIRDNRGAISPEYIRKAEDERYY